MGRPARRGLAGGAAKAAEWQATLAALTTPAPSPPTPAAGRS